MHPITRGVAAVDIDVGASDPGEEDPSPTLGVQRSPGRSTEQVALASMESPRLAEGHGLDQGAHPSGAKPRTGVSLWWTL